MYNKQYLKLISYKLESEKDNEGYVSDKLRDVLEEKIKERREFRSIVEEFRYTNKELYQKMSQAGETRNSALFNKKAKWKLATVLPVDPKKGGKRPKSAKVETETKQEEPEVVDKTKMEEVLDENDSVIQSLKWAHDLLLKEHTTRRHVRTKRGSVKRKAGGSRIHGMWTYHHMNEEKKKVKKKTGEMGIYENMKKEEPTKREETGALVDDIPKLLAQPSGYNNDEEEDYDDDEYAPKKKFEIVDLRRKLSFRRKAGKIPTKALEAWEAKTEEDKINDAKKHLAWLQEKQKKNIIVDFFGVPKTKREAIVVEPSASSVKNEVAESDDQTFEVDSTNMKHEQPVDDKNKNDDAGEGLVKLMMINTIVNVSIC